jgi:neutral ceramidase
MTSASLRAGTGRAIITPPVGMPMGGWSNALHERSLGNDGDLTATLLMATDDRGAAILCELDLCLLTDAQAAAIRGAMADATGVDPTAVRVTATHNHSAPVTGELTGAGWMREGMASVEPYMTMVTELLAGAAREARSALVPVSVGHGRGASPLAVNRRVSLPGGGIRVGHAWEGPVDHTVRVARLDDAEGRAVATVAHYSAHPTILAGGNRSISAEYPGHVRRVVESALGGRCLFLQGTPGDVGPIETFVDELDAAHRLGSMLGHDAAGAAMRSSADPHRQRVAESQDPSTWLAFYEYEPPPPSDTTVRIASRIAEMPVRPDLGDPAELRRLHADLRAQLEAALDRRADAFEIRELRVRTKGASMRAERAEALAGLAHYPMEVHGTRIGPLAFVGVPLEPFIELGLAIEERSPFPMTFVSGYTNGYRNYLPTEAEFARGGYEVEIAAFRPESASIFVESAVALLRDLATAS